jgi:ubiquinone/menaquinone biosynthesis C-methylase UbiE
MCTEKIPYIFNPNISFPGYFVRHRLLEGITKHASKLGGVMLDFGCGSKPYQSLFKVDKYVGLDYDGEGHSHENEQIDYYYDGKKIPFDDNTFDSVFTTEVFEHIFNLPEILPEIKRVMKKDALILITCPFAIAEHETPVDFARYSSFGLKHLMESNGFEIIIQEKLGNSIEVITQFWLSYLDIHIMPHLKKVPILGRVVEVVHSAILNVFAILFGKFFPKGKELYLNNLIVCRKK